MPDRAPNQIARVIAVGGVIVMFVLVIVVIAASTGGDGSGDDGTPTTTTAKLDPKIEKAREKGVYRVKEGDTLTAISEETGVDLETLIQLNPDTDPQALIEGRKIKLR